MAKIKKVSVKRDKLKTAAVEITASQFSVTPSYVYSCLRGDRKDGQATDIIRDFNQRYKAAKKAIEL